MKQVGNISTDMQQIDLPQFTMSLGWDEDEGVSGADYFLLNWLSTPWNREHQADDESEQTPAYLTATRYW